MYQTILLCLFSFLSLLGQACPVSVQVHDREGKPVTDIKVIINRDLIGNTDEAGKLTFSLADGNYRLQLWTESEIRWESDIQVNCQQENAFEFVLHRTPSHIELEEVSVYSVTEVKKMEQSPFSVQAIDLSQSYHKGGDIGEVLVRASGIKLRSDGNVGAPVQINLGGLQGKAVRIFKDGIPIELFGHGFSLGTIPVNMLERVEIYNGVMPIYLASDALGGGVNLVSRKERETFAELSYEAGSFNTHRATANARWQSKNRKWYVGTSSSFNYSDNNYTVNVPFYAQETGATEYRDTKRFHDAVRSHYVETYFGLQNRSWTDDFRLNLINSGFFKEIQHDAEMNKVYGEPYSKESSYTSLLSYRKNFLNERLNVNALATYSFFDTRFIDTAKVRYGWGGDAIGQSASPGEINLGNNQQLDYHFFSSRLNASYKLSAQHVLDFSELYYQQNRKGSDPLGAITAVERIDVLTVPAVYRKNNIALGIRSTWLDKQMESIIALKHYHFSTMGYTTDNFGLGWRTSGSGDQVGYLGGLRWSSDRYMLKVSYEFANRLPDELEIFGDARLIKENMALQPEKSHNVNLNAQYTFGSADNQLKLTTNLFYRNVRDIIFLQLDIPFSRYINYDKAKVKGFELEANYILNQRFNFGTNLTYQDIRRVGIEETMFKNLEGSRVPNVPFLFGNVWLSSYFDNILREKDRIEINWNGNYTHRFFLKAIPRSQEPGLFEHVTDLQTSLVIPRDGRLGQFTNNLGIYYHFAGSRLSCSGEVRNVGGARLYDNFNVQKPGRSFHLKLVYQFF